MLLSKLQIVSGVYRTDGLILSLQFDHKNDVSSNYFLSYFTIMIGGVKYESGTVNISYVSSLLVDFLGSTGYCFVCLNGQ